MRKGARVNVTLNMGDQIGHSVVVRSIHNRQVFKLNGSYFESYFFKIMNPTTGTSGTIYQSDIFKAFNIFYIY